MKIYKKTIFWLAGICFIVLILILLLLVHEKNFSNKDFIINISIGVFTSSFLVLLTAIIGYNVEKRSELASYSNMINCFMLKIISLFKFFKSNSNVNVETEINLVKSLYEYLFFNYHMNNPKLDMILPLIINRKEKLVNEIDDMLNDIYIPVMELNNLCWELELNIIDEDKFHDEFSKFAMLYRHYKKEDIVYSNVLGEKHQEFTKLCKLKYKKQASYQA